MPKIRCNGTRIWFCVFAVVACAKDGPPPTANHNHETPSQQLEQLLVRESGREQLGEVVSLLNARDPWLVAHALYVAGRIAETPRNHDIASGCEVVQTLHAMASDEAQHPSIRRRAAEIALQLDCPRNATANHGSPP